MNVTFDTGIVCNVIGAVNTAIVCETQRFDDASKLKSNLNVTITVNGVSDSSLQV